ncbi:MAG: alpha/beta fold hydrolase, partial [Pseudomonadota bacterium]
MKIGEHRMSYLTDGNEQHPPIIFVHGWPELSISWRHQLPVFAALGFHAIAPDMRGYGQSSIYSNHEDYAQEIVVA